MTRSQSVGGFVLRGSIALAFSTSFSAAHAAPPAFEITAPVVGGALSGYVQGPPHCVVEGTNIARVMFYLNDKWTNTDGRLWNGLGCWLDTRQYADGTYTLKAVAYSSTGESSTRTREIRIQNTAAPAPTSPTTSAPTIYFTAPAAGGALSGNVQGPPDCVVQGSNIARVMFYLNGQWTNTDGNLSNGLGCWIDTTKYANGSYTLRAVAYNSAGATASTSREILIQNGAPQPAPEPTPEPAPEPTPEPAPGPAPSPSACNAGATSAISVSAVPSRVSGIAPLSVFFDASRTTATATPRPFHELEYRWDFGDSAGGAVWTQGSGVGIASNSSKNAATGPMAAHVFESAGTYSVCLTVTDGANTARRPVTITVVAPDAAPEFSGRSTLCVDSRATPVAGQDGCPSGAAVLRSADFDSVINTTARNGAAHKRILFRRGGTYTTSATAAITATGPGLVGAYGSGAKPLVNGASGKVRFGSTSNLSFADWRIMDLSLDGQNQTAGGGNAFEAAGPFRQVTLLRVEARRGLNGILLSRWFMDQVNSTTAHRAPLWSELAVVDSIFEDLYSYGFLGHVNRFSLMGNRLRGRTGSTAAQDPASHLVRLGYSNSAVISHNHLLGDSPGNTLTIRGVPNRGDRTIPADAWTEKVVVSDNLIVGGRSVWFFTIRRVNDETEARFRNILVERNSVVASAPTLSMLVTDAGELTIRNNVWNLSGATAPSTIVLEKSALTPAGVNANVAVYNNTAYSGTAGSGNFRLVEIRSGAPASLRVRNNLSYAPDLSGTHRAVMGTPGAGAVISNNTDGTAIRTSDPRFSGTGESGLLQWRATGTDVVDRGASVPVWSDLFRAPRSGTYDLGAVNPVP